VCRGESAANGGEWPHLPAHSAYGVVPVYLSEISPVAFRAMWPGVAYQIGNMVSSASAQIEAVAGERIRSPSGVPEYGKVSAILIGVSGRVRAKRMQR
jgi:SHS family lactate transporter-like MFS transporter